MKHPNGEVMPGHGYIAAGYYGEAQYPAGYHPHPAAPQQAPQQYEDYTHYPHPEEYLTHRTGGYFAGHNGDRYAVPSKPRQRLESDCKYFRYFGGMHSANLDNLALIGTNSSVDISNSAMFQTLRTATCPGCPTPTPATTSLTSCCGSRDTSWRRGRGQS